MQVLVLVYFRLWGLFKGATAGADYPLKYRVGLFNLLSD